MASLTVLETSDSFSSVWTDLASRLGLDLFRTSDAAEAAARPAVAVIVACGGTESVVVDVLHRAARLGIEGPLIAGAEADHRLAVELMRRGAAGYYALPSDVGRLEAELTQLRDTSAGVDVGVPGPTEYDFSAIIGAHDSIAGALRLAEKVIPSSTATVLITGETGTGKELFARAIHDNGPRASKPFVAVNCSAIPSNLLESEFFGHEKGAFTDARAAKPGLFEIADGGTVFLDEISSMPFELQGKLLRFLETRELRRVGGLKSRIVDVRILAAANVDLRGMIQRREFREDLYYRLAVVRLELPPLRARGSDRTLLARHFLAELSETYGQHDSSLTSSALRAIERHPWPGNVRELRNAIERGLLFAGGQAIRPEHLAIEAVAGAPAAAPGRGGAECPIPFPATIDELERAAAVATLALCEGNKSEAARVLGITRSRLYRLLERARNSVP
ncbi:MAG: sigma-54 interaction domain-containing protein [Gemmatimonadota bacterium]